MKSGRIILIILFLAGCQRPSLFVPYNSHDIASPTYQPKPVENETARILTEGSIELTWKSLNSKIVDYLVERKISNQYKNGSFSKIAVVHPDSQSSQNYIDTLSLQRDFTYTYRIRVVDSIHTRMSKPVVSNSVTFDPKLPKPLKVKGIDPSTVDFFWKSPNSYKVALKATVLSYSTLKIIKEKEGIRDNSVTFTGLDPDKAYYFQLTFDKNYGFQVIYSLVVRYVKGLSDSRTIINSSDGRSIVKAVYLNKGMNIAVLYSDGSLDIVDKNNAALIKNIHLFDNSTFDAKYIYQMEIENNSNGLIFAVNQPDQKVMVFSDKGQVIQSFNSSASIQNSPALFALSTSGDTLAYQSADHKNLNIVLSHSGGLIDKLPVSEDLQNITISAQGNNVALAFPDSIKVWSLLSHSFLPDHVGKPLNSPKVIRFSRDGSYLFVPIQEKGVSPLYIYRISPTAGLFSESWTDDPIDEAWDAYQESLIRSMAISPVGENLAATYKTFYDNYGTIHLDLINTSNLKRSFSANVPADIKNISFSPDGKYVLCSYNSEVIEVNITKDWFIDEWSALPGAPP